jgi:hypothetical protein
MTYRDCSKCSEPVHHRSQKCRACGADSPWSAAEPADTEVQGKPAPDVSGATLEAADTLTMAHVQRGKDLLAAQPQPADFAPTDAQIASYLHSIDPANRPRTREEIETAEVEAARQAVLNGPHVFMERFSTMVGPIMAHFKPNQVVTDFPLLNFLRTVNAPMVPVSDAPCMACCPNCQTVFKVPVLVPTRRAG